MKKKLKVFRVWADHWDWDQYDSFIIVGKDQESVLKQFRADKNGNRIYLGSINDPALGLYGTPYVFGSNQGELHIEEIDLTAPALILASFNAG